MTTRDIDTMAKKLGSIKRKGLTALIHSGKEVYVCFALRQVVYIDDPKDLEDLGHWLIKAADIVRKEKNKSENV